MKRRKVYRTRRHLQYGELLPPGVQGQVIPWGESRPAVVIPLLALYYGYSFKYFSWQMHFLGFTDTGWEASFYLSHPRKYRVWHTYHMRLDREKLWWLYDRKPQYKGVYPFNLCFHHKLDDMALLVKQVTFVKNAVLVYLPVPLEVIVREYVFSYERELSEQIKRECMDKLNLQDS